MPPSTNKPAPAPKDSESKYPGTSCADGSLYTGIATNVEACFAAHACGKGARYTRSRKPIRVLASFELSGRSEALRAEYRVKRLSAQQKRELISGIKKLDSLMPQTDTEPETEQE